MQHLINLLEFISLACDLYFMGHVRKASRVYFLNDRCCRLDNFGVCICLHFADFREAVNQSVSELAALKLVTLYLQLT